MPAPRKHTSTASKAKPVSNWFPPALTSRVASTASIHSIGVTSQVQQQQQAQPGASTAGLGVQLTSGERCIYCRQGFSGIASQDCTYLVYQLQPLCPERRIRVHTKCLPACQCDIFSIQHDKDPLVPPQFYP